MMGSAAFFTVKGAFAEELTKTPEMTEGPFYPDKMPLDTDNDLLVISDSTTPGIGEVTHLSGRVLDVKGKPMRNALVEIWQVDGNGVYLHSDSGQKEKEDKNFQGYGRFLTDSKGRYYFRTIKPVSYPGRTPHIHYKVSQGDKRLLATQLLVAGEKQNKEDGLFKRIKDEKQRRSILSKFKPMKGSKTGELTAKWDLVIGMTPDEDEVTEKS